MDFPIPIRCYTCNRPLAGKWQRYKELCATYRKQEGRTENAEPVYLTAKTTITAEGKALNELELTADCCRRHLLTHPGQ